MQKERSQRYLPQIMVDGNGECSAKDLSVGAWQDQKQQRSINGKRRVSQTTCKYPMIHIVHECILIQGHIISICEDIKYYSTIFESYNVSKVENYSLRSARQKKIHYITHASISLVQCNTVALKIFGCSSENIIIARRIWWVFRLSEPAGIKLLSCTSLTSVGLQATMWCIDMHKTKKTTDKPDLNSHWNNQNKIRAKYTQINNLSFFPIYIKEN